MTRASPAVRHRAYLGRRLKSRWISPAIDKESENVPHFRIAFLSAALVVAALAGPARSAGPQIADFTLSNGLELVVIPDHRAPVVTHMIWYKVGAADETPGKSGLAHFLEHLMFKGTAKHPAGEFSASRRLASAGRRTPSPPPTTPAISSACRANSSRP